MKRIRVESANKALAVWHTEKHTVLRNEFANVSLYPMNVYSQVSSSIWLKYPGQE